MSAETIPADVWDLATKAAILINPDMLPGEIRTIATTILADRATRPAEPAAPVAEAGDGEVVAWRWRLKAEFNQPWGPGAWVYDPSLEWMARKEPTAEFEALVRLSTLEAERARADELRRERDFWENRENEALHRLAAAEQRAAVALARAEKAEGALAEAQGALVDLADWLENDCGAELPHSHIEKQVAIARGAPPRAERAERGLNVDATMALIEGALKWAVWCVGEGIMAIESEGVAAPEDFLMTYSDATGEEDWETLHERLPALLRASREAQPATDGGE